ncbi:hypothetical protein [Sphingomonas sp. KR3-1]|uniref:hypothetical protein n=1 Tax=Sphingomonas sp. KR3-1 TaxID=3156611 RepID=UPI0032B38273
MKVVANLIVAGAILLFVELFARTHAWPYAVLPAALLAGWLVVAWQNRNRTRGQTGR